MVDLKNNSNDFYEYISSDKYGKVYIILPNQRRGYNFGYSLFIPNECQIDTTLLVHCTNTGGYGVKDGKLDSSRRAVHLDEAYETAKISSLGGHLQYGFDLKIPVLTPLIPRFQGYYTHFLSSMVYNSDVSGLIQDNNERPEIDKLSDEEILEIKELCKNLPEQVANMIKDSKDVLLKMGIHIDDKVIIEGYSAGSKFANGFTVLYPELVKACICGGNSGIGVIPITHLNNQILNFPLGVADLKKFNFDLFRLIPQLYYIGDIDDNDPTLYRDCYTNQETILINKLGLNVQDRFDKLKEIYNSYGINAIFEKFNGNHKTVGNPDGPAYMSIKSFMQDVIKQKKKYDSNTKTI